MGELSFTEVSEILALIEKTECSQLSLEYGDLRISVTRTGSGNGGPVAEPPTVFWAPGSAESGFAPVDEAAPASEPETGPAEAAELATTTQASAPQENWVPVLSPSIGTFYRSPAPGEPPFVSDGDRVEAGQTVGVVEVMKLFSNVTTDVAGTVAGLPVADGELVEHEQPLVWIEPQ